MRATRNLNKNTPPPKKAVRATHSKAVRNEKQENEPTPDAKAAASAAHDRKNEVNGEANASDSPENLTIAADIVTEPPKGKEVAELGTQSHVEESSFNQTQDPLQDNAASVGAANSTPDQYELDEAPASLEIGDEEEMVEEEVDDVGEEEQVAALENEDEENLEMEGYNDDEEIEGVEEVEGFEEVDDEVEEEIEEAEEVEEEDNNEVEGEEQILEQRPVTERQKRKKFEVFVGGLDKDATEDDVRKAFEGVGEVVEVRLMRHPQTGKNKGYAFVRFATVEQAKRAAELERIKIRDKECGVVPSEDNDTIFVGNICKSWKKEQVLEKLKAYGVEGVEEVTLMTDSKNEELNRGYAFLELATHNYALKAFARLSKRDAIFGSDRSAKVAWAEPLLDEEVLAKVKSVFIDGIPSTWDEAKVREQFVQYGEIERIVLAKDNPKSKRNDYAFVNYASRESAVACVEALRNGQLTDGDKKVKVTVAFSKALPRKKHIKGSRGGYPIGGRPSVRGRAWPSHRGSFSIPRGRGGRGFSRGPKIGRGGGRRPYDEPRFIRGPKKHITDERSFSDDRSRIRPPPRDVVPHSSRGGPRGPLGRHDEITHSRRPSYEYSSSRGRGNSSRRGRGAVYRDEYTPRGGRLSPGFPRARGYLGRPMPRDELYPRRPDRGHSYDRGMDPGYVASVPNFSESGPGMKRSYAAVDEAAMYYDIAHRGYPRPRLDYAADPEPVAGTHYSEAVRAPLRSALSGRSAMPTVGNASMPPASVSIYEQPGSMYAPGGHGYTPVMAGNTDYGTGAGELRGSYNSSLYGGRGTSGYGLPGGGSGSYF